MFFLTWPRAAARPSKWVRGAPAGVLLALATMPAMPAVAAPSQPEPQLSAPLTADALAGAVLARNPNLQALQAAVAQAQAGVRPAGSLDDPMLSYLSAPETIGSELGTRHIVQFSQAIPWPGTLRLREQAASREAEAADHAAQAYRLEVAAAARSLLAEWYFLDRALAINDGKQALLAELIDTARTRYASGRASQQDVLQAEVERGLLQRARLELTRRARTVRAQINALLNRAPDVPLPAAAVAAGDAAPMTLEAVRSAALQHHPELARLRAMLAASDARTALAGKAFYPDFRIQSNYLGTLDPDEKRLQVGVSINVPLDRGRRHAALDAARAATQRVQWQLADREAQLLSRIEAAYAAWEETRDTRLLYRDRLLPLARENLAAARADYRAGGGAFLNVITAEQRLLQTELALERARADQLRAQAQLLRWAGDPATAAY